MDENKFSFVVYMIHACADRWNVAPSKVYLVPNYDILHTQSTNYVVQDIEEYLNERGIST